MRFTHRSTGDELRATMELTSGTNIPEQLASDCHLELLADMLGEQVGPTGDRFSPIDVDGKELIVWEGRMRCARGDLTGDTGEIVHHLDHCGSLHRRRAREQMHDRSADRQAR